MYFIAGDTAPMLYAAFQQNACSSQKFAPSDDCAEGLPAELLQEHMVTHPVPALDYES